MEKINTLGGKPGGGETLRKKERSPSNTDVSLALEVDSRFFFCDAGKDRLRLLGKKGNVQEREHVLAKGEGQSSAGWGQE